MQDTHIEENNIEAKQWMKEFPKVAHYTTYEGLEGILSSRKLWATHYSFLKDSSELMHGKKYITEIAQQAAQSLGYSEEGLEDIWWKALAPNGHDPECFVTSFCGIEASCDKPELEDNGLLSQWRGYGGKGGFAIIFDSSELEKSYCSFGKKCKNHPGPGSRENCKDCPIHFNAHLFMKVEYEHSIAIIKNMRANGSTIYEIIENGSKELIDHYVQNIPHRSQSAHDFDAYYKAIIGLLLALKHYSFKEENEVRFACLNRLEVHEMRGGGYANQSPYEICIENKVPRLKIDFNPLAVKKIIIGPQPNQEQTEIVIRYLLEKHQYENVSIIKSEIPFIP